MTAFSTEEFFADPPEGGFTGMLAAHLVEHLPPNGAAEVLRPYLPFLAPATRVVLICPQERGYASDAHDHTVFFDFARLRSLCEELGLTVQRELSFPFPRFAGRVFTYNEFVTVAEMP